MAVILTLTGSLSTALLMYLWTAVAGRTNRDEAECQND